MIRIVRVLAPNPSVYTLEGTNTWVVGASPAFVIDPGPLDERHLDEVARAAAFAERVGAPLRAWRLNGAEHVKDGEHLTSGDVTLVAVHTPGHSGDHVCFFSSEDGALFTGDTVVGRGTSFVDPPDGDLAKYLQSLQRLLDLGPRTIYPGHGPVVLDAPGVLRGYLEHRAEREAQVLSGLADGPVAVDDLVVAIYQGYPREVLPLAARSVTAHLLKLEAEGRAEKKGRGASQTWTASSPKACARCGRPVKGRARYCNSCMLTMLQEGGDRADAQTEPTTRSGERTT